VKYTPKEKLQIQNIKSNKTNSWQQLRYVTIK